MKIKLLLAALVLGVVTSCTTIDSGHRGVEVSWGGETNMESVLSEGMDGGLHWLWDEAIEYDVREKTLVHKFEFNDKNNMSTGVELSLDFNLDPNNVNKIHRYITDIGAKIHKTLKSAGKEVIPQYSAVELNITKRVEAEKKLSKILEDELPEFYVQFARIQMTDVDIPEKVAKLAEETAVQLGRNELAEKKEAEKVALAKAQIAEAKGSFEAAEFDAKRKAILSQPKMLELQKVENEKIMWKGFYKHGKSPYGRSNIFGGETSIVRGLK